MRLAGLHAERRTRKRRRPGARARRRRSFRAALFAALCGLQTSTFSVLLSGCRDAKPPPPPSVSDTAGRGPLKLTATATPSDVWFGDPVTLELRVLTPDDYLVRFPAANAFAELEATAGPAGDARPAAEGGLEWRQSYAVAALSPGTLEIPPAVVAYARRPAAADAAPEYAHELVTGTLKVNVRSALTTQDSVQAPRDITGTRLSPEPVSPWRRAAWVGGVVAAAALVYVAFRLLRAWLIRPAPPVAPEVWALRALQELVAADWIAAGRVREFYYRLSEIVRAYIERKFALAAPEMTTEEFLNSLATDRNPLPCDPGRLREFLSACDIVKYAGYLPTHAAADDAVATARAFIDATAAAAASAAEARSRFHRPAAGVAA